MNWVEKLVYTNGAVDPTKLAAWFGCLGTLYMFASRLKSATASYMSRPRIARPLFGVAVFDSSTTYYPYVTLENKSASSLDVDRVRLRYNQKVCKLLS